MPWLETLQLVRQQANVAVSQKFRSQRYHQHRHQGLERQTAQRGGDSNQIWLSTTTECFSCSALPVDCFGSAGRQRYHQNWRKRLWPQIVPGSRTKRVSPTGFTLRCRRKPRTCRAQMPLQSKCRFLLQYQWIRWRRGRPPYCASAPSMTSSQQAKNIRFLGHFISSRPLTSTSISPIC